MSAKFAIHHEPFFLCRFSEQAVFIGWIQAWVEINRRKEDLKLHAKRTNDAIQEG